MNNLNQTDDKLCTQKKIIELAEYNRKDTLNSLKINDDKIKLFLGFQFIFAIQAFIFLKDINVLEVCQSFVFIIWLIFWSITSAILIKNILGKKIYAQIETSQLFENDYESYGIFLKKYHKSLIKNIKEIDELLAKRTNGFKWSVVFFTLSILPFIIEIILNCLIYVL